MPPSGDPPRVDILPGTLELIVLRTLTTMGPQHAYGIAARIEQVADHSVRLNQGTLYPALVRLEQKGWIAGSWQTTESNRRRSIPRSLDRESAPLPSRPSGGSARRIWSIVC